MAAFGTNLDLFLKLRGGGDLKQYTFLYESVVSAIPSEISQEDHKRIKEFCRFFCINIATKWANCGRSLKTFLNKENNRKWLESSINWPTCDTVDLKTVMDYTREEASEAGLNPIQVLPSMSTAKHFYRAGPKKTIPGFKQQTKKKTYFFRYG